jgi:hypothetical protein
MFGQPRRRRSPECEEAVSTDAPGLNQPQRRAIGVRLESMRRLLADLRQAGFDSTRLPELEDAMRDVGWETRAIAPEAPRSFVQATLAQMWVLAMELRARELASHGELDADAAAALDEHSRRLSGLVTELIDEHEARSRTDAVRADRRRDRR